MEDIKHIKGPWSRIIRHDPITGVLCMTYSCDGRPGYAVNINSPKVKTLGGFMLIEHDLESAISWLKEILGLDESDKTITGKSGHIFLLEYGSKSSMQRLALFVAAVTFYGKCFTKCEGRRAQLQKSNLNEEFHGSHDFAMLCRNNFTAHSGALKFESANTVLLLDSGRKEIPDLVSEISQTQSLVSNSIQDIVVLFEHAKSFATNKIRKLYSQIMNEDIYSKPAAYWYQTYENQRTGKK